MKDLTSPTLDVYLHETYPRLAAFWDGKPVIYMSYAAPIAGGGTLPLGSLYSEVEDLTKGIAEQIKTTYRPAGTRIRIWNGSQERVDVHPGEIISPPITGLLNKSIYQDILSNLREKYPEIPFEEFKD